MAHPFKKKYKVTYKRTIVDYPVAIQIDNEFCIMDSLVRAYESQGIILVDFSDTNTQ